MAGDSRLFQEALKRGSSFAWNEQWDRAAGEYRLALEQFPEDVAAKNHLAMALYRAGHFTESLELYQALWKSQPANMGVLQRMTELQELLGDKESAAAGYRVLAELQTRRGAHSQALQSWQKVVQLKPDSLFFWNSLMDSAVQLGAVASVLPGYLNAARDVALQGRFDDALRIAERAQSLDPANPAVLSLLSGIRRGLEHSWRAASLGKQPQPDELAVLIPPLRFEPHISSRPGPQVPPRRPDAPTRPVVPAYAPPPVGVPETAPAREAQPLSETESQVPVPASEERRAPEPRETAGEEAIAAAPPGAGGESLPAPAEAAPETAAPVEVHEESEPDLATERPQEAPPAEVEVPESEETAPPVVAEIETAWDVAVRPAVEEELPEALEESAGAIESAPDTVAGEPAGLPEEEETEAITSVAEEPPATMVVAEVEAEPAIEIEDVEAAPEVDELPVTGVEQEEPAEGPAAAPGLAEIEQVEDEPAVEIPAESEDAPEETPEPVAAEAMYSEEQADEPAGPRQQKGWLSRLAGFLWQPGDEPAGPHAVPSPAAAEGELPPVESVEEPVAGEEGLEAAGEEPPAWEEPELEPGVAADEAIVAVSGDSQDGAKEAPPEVPASSEIEAEAAADSMEELAAVEPDEAADIVVPPAALPADVGYGVEAEAEAGPAVVEGVDLVPEGAAGSPLPGEVVQDEEVSDPHVAKLLRQVQEVREAGRLEEAVEMLEDSISSGTSVPIQLAELAEIYTQLGQVERAIGAYQQALESAPHLPRALLGLARLRYASEELDAAQESAQRAVQVSTPATSGDAVDLLLEILRERAALGQSGPVAETLSFLLASVNVAALPQAVAESLLAAPVDLFGRAVGEHLAEVAGLQSEVRDAMMVALMRAEEQLRLGSLRSAADEMYAIVATMPDFLPAQSLLGRILVAQGMTDEARDRARRLIRLYELRGEAHYSLEVLWWAVAQGVANGEAKDQLVEMLRSRGRIEEAESVDLGWGEPFPREGATRPAASRSVSGGAPSVIAGRTSALPLPAEAELAALPLEELLRLAEKRIAGGDRQAARKLVRVAIELREVGEAHRAALLRILQLVDPDGNEREELVEALTRLGLPLELADY